MKTACRKGSQELTFFTTRNIPYSLTLMFLFLLNSGFKQYGSRLKNDQLFSFAGKGDCNQLRFEIINGEGRWEKVNSFLFALK